MNVLIIGANSKYIHSSLSVWYLYSAIKRVCMNTIKAAVLECTINQPETDVIQKIYRKNPDVLAFSCYIWNISFIRKLIRRIAGILPHVPVILGGPEVSYNPEEILSENPHVHFVIAGEGEAAFPELLMRMHKGTTYNDIPGLCFRDKTGRTVCNPQSEPMAEPPSPYTHEYFQSLAGRIAYLETSRGCPYSCTFCLSGLSNCRVRFFDLERAKHELLLLANSGTQTIKLVDRTFNSHPRRAYELFDYIIQNAGSRIPEGVCFHFEVAADLFDDNTLDLLALAPPGLIQLEAGLQSFHAETLGAVRRKTDIQKLEENLCRLLKKQNIHLHVDLIAGLPYENLETFMDSFDRAFRLSPHMLQLGFLKMLHGSDLRKEADGMGYVYSKEPPYEMIRTPWISKSDIKALKNAEISLQRLYNSGRFLLTLGYLVKAAGLRPFKIFEGFGACLEIGVPMSLDELTKAAYDYFSGLSGVDSGALRDAMVCDRIAAGGKIPEFLKIPDKDFKRVINHIRNSCIESKNAKINAAILYAGTKRAVYATGEKSAVTGRYALQFVPIQI